MVSSGLLVRLKRLEQKSCLRNIVEQTKELQGSKELSCNEYLYSKPWCNDLLKVRYGNPRASSADTARLALQGRVVDGLVPMGAIRQTGKIVPSFIRHPQPSHAS